MIENPNDPEDLFDSWVIAYHDALADSGLRAAIPAVPPSPELEPRLEQARTCLQLLERVWPRARSDATAFPRQIGRFRVLQQLGCGAFGIVFLAEDPKLGRRVALKVPRAETLLQPEL